MAETTYERGMRIRRQVLGEQHVARAEALKTDLDADFQRFITETAWGTVWARGTLDLKTRHLVTIGMLVACGKDHEPPGGAQRGLPAGCPIRRPPRRQPRLRHRQAGIRRGDRARRGTVICSSAIEPGATP